MRFGTSSPLDHESAREWAERQVGLGCKTVVFPVQSDSPIGKIDSYKNAAAEFGITIAEVGIWRNALSQDPAERKANMDYCVEQLRLADYLGARCAVNVAGAFGPRWDGHYKANFSKEAREETVKMVREIIDRANVKNTYFTLEPMPWMVPTGPKDYVRLLEEVDRDRFAVHMDIINITNSAERYFNPHDLVDECVDLLGPKIRSCHIKDVHLKEEYTFQLEECAPGLGEFPLGYYMKKMNELDSDMPMIVEHLETDEEYIKYLKVVQNIAANL